MKRASYYSGDTLGDLWLTWDNNISPDRTVEIVNYMLDHAAAGDVIFYDCCQIHYGHIYKECF